MRDKVRCRCAFIKRAQGKSLRYLKFNDIYIDTANQLLIKAGESKALPPKVYDLLVFFCLNQQRVISKDELMEQVWSGTIVTENAISRTLVKVRKALDDDPKNPKFIITVPRKGYRMVAEFEEAEQIVLTQSNELSANHQAEKSITSEITSVDHQENQANGQLWGKDPALKIIVLTIVILSISALFYAIDSQQTEKILTKQITPLTRAIADEIYPAVSPDLTKLAYTKQRKGQLDYINIEDLTSKAIQSIAHPRGKLSKPVWSPTENKLAFLYQHNHVCMIFSAELADIKNKDTWQSISECGSDSSPQFVFSPNGQYFYFNDRQSNTNGYQVFRVNLSTGQKEIVNQPITSGLGNYAFDISPDGERLVLLNSEFAPQTRIYTLDIADSVLTQTAQLPYLMRSVRWGHDNSTIIHPAPHPAYDIWQSDLKGEKLAIFASNTSRVKHLARINNGKDFSFVSYLLNRDIFFQQDKENNAGELISYALDNSSVMDYLPTLANHSQQYAFVSKRSTTAEVYISTIDEKTNSPKQTQRLTFFNNPVKIYHLAFSPDDSQLLIVADNQLYIADISTLSVKPLPLDNIAIQGASWQDEQNLLFSTIKNNAWYFMRYNITSEQLTSLPSGYQAGLYSQATESYYLIADETSQVMQLKTINSSPEKTALVCAPNFKNRKLNLIETATGIACLSTNDAGFIQHDFLKPNSIEQGSTSKNTLFDSTLLNNTRNLDFDTNKQGMVYTKMTQSVADIMRTTSN